MYQSTWRICFQTWKSLRLNPETHPFLVGKKKKKTIPTTFHHLIIWMMSKCKFQMLNIPVHQVLPLLWFFPLGRSWNWVMWSLHGWDPNHPPRGQSILQFRGCTHQILRRFLQIVSSTRITVSTLW